MSKLVSPINFKAWIEENRHLLKPPVGNKVVWKDGDYIVMVVGGPNSRKDYHYNETPEFFYQVEGDMVLKIMYNGVPEDIQSLNQPYSLLVEVNAELLEVTNKSHLP